ncbi:MAG: hypothetical protein CVV05_15450 [Gammaproteobacteria bacterium HGW-Gammaproteobacteria-1]|jgi:hypothetical protein|nr:MAG: hypothetical protein CVV05_15450 [Gammaproteobacteria bacterium HGW-Gammaproteobacteria-1]
MAFKSTIPAEQWEKRISSARTRREKYESVWAQYARLHTNAYQAVADKNDDALIALPNGDQVKLGLVHSNIEQTLALLEVPEVGVRATAFDFDRELGAADTHREAVVEAGVHRSLMRSGLLTGPETVDAVKHDAVIIGHGVIYSGWSVIEEEIETDEISVLHETEPGVYAPLLDTDGLPIYEPQIEMQVLFDGVRDEHVSPLEFLFEASARSIPAANWHGMEKIVPLDVARQDPRYHIPAWVEPTSYRLKNIYGEESDVEECEADSVKLIVIYDKVHRELLTFLEATKPATGKGKNAKPDKGLVTIAAQKFPVRFTAPDASPFSVFVPLPANDHPFGISQIEHTRNPAVEADKLRTRMANLTRQLKRIPWAKKGRVDPDQLTRAFTKPDAEPVLLDIQENEDPSKLFGELPFPVVHTELFAGIQQARDDIRWASGVSEVPFGGASTATESENLMAVGGARPNRKRRLYLSFLTRIANLHRDYLRQFAPEGQPIRTMGESGEELLLTYGREAFEGDIELEVVAGGGATAISPVKQKMLLEMGNAFMGKFGPEFDLVFMRQALTTMDARDINHLMRAARNGVLGNQGGPLPGKPQQPAANLDNYTDGQAIRAAINAPSEGRITR